MELVFILYKPLVTFSTKLQGCKEPSKILKVLFFGKYQIFLVQLKDGTQIKRICANTFDVRHDTKHHRASQGRNNRPIKMQFFSIVSFVK